MEQKTKLVTNGIIFSLTRKHLLFYSTPYISTTFNKTTWFEVDGPYITVLTASSSVSTSECCLRRKQCIVAIVPVFEPLPIRM